jgi:hypothetical protein
MGFPRGDAGSRPIPADDWYEIRSSAFSADHPDVAWLADHGSLFKYCSRIEERISRLRAAADEKSGYSRVVQR